MFFLAIVRFLVSSYILVSIGAWTGILKLHLLEPPRTEVSCWLRELHCAAASTLSYVALHPMNNSALSLAAT